MEKQWTFIPPSADFHWFSWDKKGSKAAASPIQHNIYKLYISPVPEQLPDVFLKSIPVLSVSKAFHFKKGSTKQGLTRPDKMVVYFSDKKSLFEAATILEPILNHYSVQGVPFTCQLGKTGMLSYGIDPPVENGPVGKIDGSWRMNVTGHLALAILQARQEIHAPEKILRFIEAKLWATGICMQNWSALNEDEN